LLKQFTGIDDPYEMPLHPELVIDTSEASIRLAVNQVMVHLQSEGYLADSEP